METEIDKSKLTESQLCHKSIGELILKQIHEFEFHSDKPHFKIYTNMPIAWTCNIRACAINNHIWNDIRIIVFDLIEIVTWNNGNAEIVVYDLADPNAIEEAVQYINKQLIKFKTHYRSSHGKPEVSLVTN